MKTNFINHISIKTRYPDETAGIMKTNFINHISALLFILLSFTSPAKEDPFEKIFVRELPNKMKYFMADSPNSQLTTIEFEVKTGWEAEKTEEYGLAHLIEHILFRDGQFKNNMSYLQVFKEKGGEVNAFVTGRRTIYTVTIDSKHSLWVLQTMTKLLQNRTFEESELRKAKQSIMIEVGEPSPFERLFKLSNSEIYNKLSLKDKRPSFFKNEFGVDLSKPNYSRVLSKLNGKNLSLLQAQNFYEEFYIPKNIKLFIAGNFNKKQFISFIERNWKDYQTKAEGRSLPDEAKVQFVDRPFYFMKASSYPSINLGIKVSNLQLKELAILQAYFSFTANKIMKNVRNKKGETYTASFDRNFYKNNGAVYVDMDSTPKAFDRNFKKLKQLLLEKPQKENISLSDFEKAKKNLKHSFDTSYEENARSLLSNLHLVDTYKEVYNFTGSPIKLIEELTLEEYNQTLKKLIQKKRYVIQKHPKHLFFYYESFLLIFLSLLLSLIIIKRILIKPFDHFVVRFVKNIKPIPFKLYEVLLIFLSLIITDWIHLFLETYIFYNNKLLQSNLITADYLGSMIAISIFVMIFMLLLNISPRKIYLTDDFLYIKSISYRIKKIPLSKIEKFESIPYWRLCLSLKRIWKIKYRYYMYRHLIPWKKVLLVSLKNNKMMVLDCGITSPILEKLNKKISSL